MVTVKKRRMGVFRIAFRPDVDMWEVTEWGDHRGFFINKESAFLWIEQLKGQPNV